MQLGDSFALVDVTLVGSDEPEPREHVVVVVEGGDITDVLPLAGYRRREGVQEVDLQGCFVLPGLIDAHVHLAGGRATIEDQELGAIAEPRLLRAIRSVAEAQALLRRGFTAVRDISWNGLYLKRVFREGSLPGPRVIACGPGLSRTGGHGDCYQYEEDYVTRNHVWAVLADGPDEVRKWVRRILREGADQIKLWASGGDNWANDLSGDQHYSLEEMQVAVEEARRQTGTMVCAHAESRDAIHAALVAGVDTIEHGGALDEELCELMVGRGAILVPTLYLMTRWFEEFAGSAERPVEGVRTPVFLHRDVDDQPDDAECRRQAASISDNFRFARSKGVKVALGSDTVFTPLTPYGEYSARELLMLVDHGLTPLEAIVAATATGAEALGMAHRIGTVETGKAADFLVLTADPTADARVLYEAGNIRWVISHGRLAVEEGRLAW